MPRALCTVSYQLFLLQSWFNFPGAPKAGLSQLGALCPGPMNLEIDHTLFIIFKYIDTNIPPTHSHSLVAYCNILYIYINKLNDKSKCIKSIFGLTKTQVYSTNSSLMLISEQLWYTSLEKCQQKNPRLLFDITFDLSKSEYDMN